MKYINEFLTHFSERPTFTKVEVERFLKQSRAGRTYSKRFVSNLLQHQRIIRITKGVYTLHDNAEVIGFAFSPFYYGLMYALSYYDIIEERANPIILTTRIVRTGTRNIMGLNAQIFRLPKNLFFGYVMVKGTEFYYPISDIEKTFLDLRYFKINLNERVMERLKQKINRKKLKEYSKMYQFLR
ncbi:hypothetical protein IHE50_00555 [Candidatus Parvarchaeota archaeon]|jgi:predicted transcriptional regulator of viral defense system|uniref:Transcriptional regulator n=1 Tax=Candidatus Acidifodinimicrobium mancum TaxID=2898728 RepID=A0A8T3UWR2_9ARCH|nr:hypothetical protein [Candidatus Acidifodinimicrobium mancum]MBE5729288.1 hypothetical protein [Candidatus Acidifodinimicrobium mancum]